MKGASLLVRLVWLCQLSEVLFMTMTARGYPTQGYRSGAQAFKSLPRASSSTAADSVGEQLLKELLDPNLLSRKNALILEEMLDRPAVAQAVKQVVRAPLRLLPVVDAFLLGFDLTNLALDYWSRKTEVQQDGNGWYINPNLTGYTEYCREGSGNFWTATESACGSIAFGNDGSGNWHGTQLPLTAYAINENVREDFTWLGGPGQNRDYRVALLYRKSVDSPAINDPIITPTGGLVDIPAPPDIFSEGGEPDNKPQVEPDNPARFYITTGSTPPQNPNGVVYPTARNTIEKKYRATGLLATVGKIIKLGINAATESCDFVEAMWDAVPEKDRVNLGYQYEKIKYRREPPKPGAPVYKMSSPTRLTKVSTGDGFYKTERRTVETKQVKVKPKLLKDALGRKIVESKHLSRISCTRKAKSFAQNPRLLDMVDMDKAIQNLIVNQFEDWAIGQANSRTNKAYLKARESNGSNYSPFSIGTGGAF